MANNAIFGNEVKGILNSINHQIDIEEIKEAVDRRDFPYYTDKDYLPKKAEDLEYRHYYKHK